MNTYPHLSCLGISKLIAKDVIDIWKAVNPRLPLLKEISVVNKVLFTNPSARVGYDTRSIFKRSLTGFEFRVFLLLD